MTMSTFPTVDLGDQITATCAFAAADGSPLNPTSLRWRVRTPAGVEALIPGDAFSITIAGITYGVIGELGLARYTLTFTPNASGVWAIRCEGLGAVQQSAEGAVYVALSALSSASI